MGHEIMSEKPSIGFVGIFETKLDNMKKKIDKELKKKKQDRNKVNLKKLIKEANRLKRVVKMAKKENITKCPHCGKEL